MPRKKTQWLSVEDFPPDIQLLLRAYHTVFGLHYTSNILDDVSDGPRPWIIIRRCGVVAAHQIVQLYKMVGLLEIGSKTRGYLTLYLSGPTTLEVVAYDPHENFRFMATKK
jgi:hypothetical protein